jgi:hypothetical protein
LIYSIQRLEQRPSRHRRSFRRRRSIHYIDRNHTLDAITDPFADAQILEEPPLSACRSPPPVSPSSALAASSPSRPCAQVALSAFLCCDLLPGASATADLFSFPISSHPPPLPGEHADRRSSRRSWLGSSSPRCRRRLWRRWAKRSRGTLHLPVRQLVGVERISSCNLQNSVWLLEQVRRSCCSCVSRLLATDLQVSSMSRCLIFVTFLTYHCYF